MEAIGLNPIRLDAIGIDPIRLNAIRLGIPGASSDSSARPYIDPEVLASLVAVCICDGKSNDDPDRAVIKNLVDPDNPFVISNAAYTKGSGYADKDSPYYGALVTDGVDDLIVSSKTVQEMLDGSNEITVVSMIHHITGTDVSSFNSVRNFTSVTGRNKLNINNKPINKTGIYGWSRSNLNTVQATTMINNILGDNKDYQTINNDILSFDSIYSIEGYNAENGAQEVSQVAWYWTFIANRVLTTDEINQVIAYYNLDKYVKPDVYYDVKKQGLSNNTPDADWYLKDFSDNGRDMQLYNYGKTPESGINEEGGLQSDGITDYGKAENLPIYKDYTVVADREIVDGLINNADGGVATRGTKWDTGAFCFDYTDGVYSFGATNGYVDRVKPNRFISYMSKYIHNGITTPVGDAVDNNPLCIAKLGSSIDRYSKLALWSFLLFPYSLSEFLLERQLKKYKLGTLYPDMVEFRPIINVDMSLIVDIEFKLNDLKVISTGDYIPVNSNVSIRIDLKNYLLDEVASFKCNGRVIQMNKLGNYWKGYLTVDKFPQKIDITIDEYIRFEDIVQPYPAIVNIPKVDGGYYTYGDKIPVGYRFRRESAINLLPELYSLSDIFLNGELCNVGAEIVISKSMVFTANKAWLLDTTEPHAIYSPQKLNIPNSSLKILGYVPDLTGKGNHGKLNNFAYTEDSGVAADGSIKFDGTDDHITIPTLAHGGKCVMMKVNWTKAGMLYDQRLNSSFYLFGIYTSEGLPAYNARNNGSTYIDGILNTNIIPSDLVGITHNITVVNDKATDDNTISPILGASVTNATFSGMFLYEFMLFHEIPSEDEIKKLNDVMGIEGGYVESPDYYWDAYGKSNNLDEDIDLKELGLNNARSMILDKSIEGLEAIEHYKNTGSVVNLSLRRLSLNNFAFNEESGYVDNGLVSDGVEDNLKNANMPVLTDYTWIMKRKRLNDKALTILCHKGEATSSGAFLFEYIEGGINTRSFGATNNVTFPDLISYQTKNSYNGQSISVGSNVDGTQLRIFMGGDTYPYYTKAVFYKAMLYSKTIDMLSINMLKNLFAKDELIDLNNPIFKK